MLEDKITFLLILITFGPLLIHRPLHITKLMYISNITRSVIYKCRLHPIVGREDLLGRTDV
jgi:hypothetical protein